MSSRTKSTKPLRPVARYRRGQAPANAGLDSESSDEGQEEPGEDGNREEEEEEEEENKVERGSKGKETGRTMAITLKEVEIDAQGSVRVGGREEVGKTGRELEDEEESESEEEAKPSVSRAGAVVSDEGSSEYETDSDDEPAPIYKPVFVSKRNRDTIAERAKELDPDALEEKRLIELETRKKISHDLVADSILRELALKEVEQTFPDVDDADGLDELAEFEAWKLRELMRIKRDTEAKYAREKEREEVEERRALPEGLRLKEDTERARKSRADKKKGSQVFMQTYHHKGAFYTDSEILTKHDYTEATESTVRNMESLPAAMQVRNFGKMSQSKYTHLAAEDTTNANFKKGAGAWANSKLGQSSGVGRDSTDGACFNCGGHHLKHDCTQGPSGGGGRYSDAPVRDSASRDAGWGSRPRPPSTPSTSTSQTPSVQQRNSRPTADDLSSSRPPPSGPSADSRYGSNSNSRDSSDRPAQSRYNDNYSSSTRKREDDGYVARSRGNDRNDSSRNSLSRRDDDRDRDPEDRRRHDERRRSRSRSRGDERRDEHDKRRKVY